MEFEWDENKRQDVWKKHKIDLPGAALIFENEAELEIWEDPRHGDETRFTAIGRIDGAWICVVFTDRGEVRRLITAWKLDEKSRRKAKARFARRAAGHEKPG